MLSKRQPVEIFMASDDNYAPHLCASMASIIANTGRELRFNILNSGLSECSKGNIAQLCAENVYIDFLEVDKSLFENFYVIAKHISLESCYRYCIERIKPDIDKAIYLDCDTIVLGDIGGLFDIDISDVCAGVVDDVIRESYIKSLGLSRYFNSGVMLLNLAKMREINAAQKLFEISAKLSGKTKYLDQDALNIIFSGDEKFLPQRWNSVAPLFRRKPKMKYAVQSDIRDAVYNPGIVHFTGPDKPWKIPYTFLAHPYTPAYFYYLSKTPYAGKADDIFGQFRPFAALANYIKRHLFFFLKPGFLDMRRLYSKNLRKFSVAGAK